MKKGMLIKKLSSVVLTVAMIVTMFAAFGTVGVSAALATYTDDFNWWVRNNGANVNNWTCAAESVDGNYALHIVNSTAVSGSNKSIQITNPYAFANMPLGKGIKIVFDMKGFDANDTESKIFLAVNRNSALSNLESTKTEVTGRDGWYTYTFSTNSMGKNNLPGMFFSISDAYECDFYIDNVHMYALDENNEPIATVDYIEDGDFESGKKVGYNGTTKYAMKNQPDILGWNIFGVSGAKYDANAMGAESVLDKSNARSGNGSMRIIRKSTNNQNTSPMLRLETSALVPGGTYTLTFYAKTSAMGTTGFMWQFNDNTKVYNDFTVEDDSEHQGWKKYTASFTSGQGPLKFIIYDEFDGYIDDMTFTDASGNNALANGTFDVDTSDYEPSNPFIISTLQSGGVNNISWRNPKSGTVTKVSLYKLADGKWNLISDAYSTDADKVFEEYDSNLDSETVYTYKLRFEFSDSESREIVLSKKPVRVGYEDRKAGNSWGITDRATDTKNQYFLPNNVIIDATEKASGTASLHMFTNKSYDTANRPDVSGDNWTASYFSRLQQAMTTTEKGKYYRLSYKIKVNNATNVSSSTKRVIIGGGASDGSSFPYSAGSTNGWEEKTIDLPVRDGSGAAPGPFQWYLGSDDVQDLWIDDITLYELTGQNGDVVENPINHITDGGFENYTAAAAITGEKATGGNKSAAIEWTAPADSRYIRVYETTDDGDVLRAVCEPSSGGVTIENLSNDTEYTFKLQSQNKNGVLSDKVTVSATPTPPNYEIESDFGFKLGGTAATAISGNGTYSVSLDVTNYRESNFAPALIVALYKDDILIECNKSDDALPSDGTTKTLNASVSVSDYNADSEYEISAFFWNGFDTMKPLLRSLSWKNK